MKLLLWCVLTHWLLLICLPVYGSDQKKKEPIYELSAGQTTLPLTSQQAAPPIHILQKSESYLEFVTKGGEKLRFRVKLVIDVNPVENDAAVTMEVFQGTKLVTRRNLDFFW